ncbi:hypothetical protein [Anaerobacillus alkalidiazotrophicus]|nr:hypothetical protein [Anaerobacillus alkalidiazotrophicus]
MGGAYGTLLDRANRLVFNEKFQRIAEQLKQSLKEFDYVLLEIEKLN